MLSNNIKTNYKKEIAYILISGIISLIAAYIFLDLKHSDLRVPFAYDGDGLGGLYAAQNLITGNGVFLYPNMGAPGTFTFINSLGIAHIHIFWVWVFSLFIKEAGLLVNLFYLSTFITISIAATATLRTLKIDPYFSIFGGVIYSLLPYHFYRGTNHIYLSTYAIVPLSCLLILWIINGEITFGKFNFRDGNLLKNIVHAIPNKTLISIIIAIFIGLTNPYYMFFSCLGMVFAIAWNFLEEKNIRKAISASLILLVVLTTMVILLIPFFLARFKGVMPESQIFNRQKVDIEIFYLRFAQLILPIIGHRLNFLAKIRDYYENNISLFPYHENVSSSLGLFLSIGLIISIFIALSKRFKNFENKNINNSAILIVFIIILGIQGGVSSFIAFFVSSFRCYNRLSIFIAFYSFFIISYYLDNFLLKLKIKKVTKVLFIITIGLISILDLVSNKEFYDIKQNPEKYYSDKDFIKKIEEITPAGSMVFQLPFAPLTVYSVFKIEPYGQFVPFIHSNSLRWSVRPQGNSACEKWQRITSGSPTEEMLKYLGGVGFKGLFIDSFGYNEKDYAELTNNIIKATGVKPIINSNERLEYFYLDEYFNNLKNNFNKIDTMVYSNWSDNRFSIILKTNTDYTISNLFERGIFLSGWSNLEDWGIWSEGSNAQLEFNLREKKDFLLKIDIMAFPDPTYFSVNVNGRKIADYSVKGKYENSTLTIPVMKDYLAMNENELYPVDIRINIKNPQSPGNYDIRKLGIGIMDFSINTLEVE